ncbi:unnamed protein product [Chrysoparadoxa australica]
MVLTRIPRIALRRLSSGPSSSQNEARAWLEREVGLSSKEVAGMVAQVPGLLKISVPRMATAYGWIQEEYGSTLARQWVTSAPFVLGLDVKEGLKPRIDDLDEDKLRQLKADPMLLFRPSNSKKATQGKTAPVNPFAKLRYNVPEVQVAEEIVTHPVVGKRSKKSDKMNQRATHPAQREGPPAATATAGKGNGPMAGLNSMEPGAWETGMKDAIEPAQLKQEAPLEHPHLDADLTAKAYPAGYPVAQLEDEFGFTNAESIRLIQAAPDMAFDAQGTEADESFEELSTQLRWLKETFFPDDEDFSRVRRAVLKAPAILSQSTELHSKVLDFLLVKFAGDEKEKLSYVSKHPALLLKFQKLPIWRKRIEQLKEANVDVLWSEHRHLVCVSSDSTFNARLPEAQ